jgi:hypothetical protein
MKLEFSRPIFENYSNIIFHGNPYSRSRVIACGQNDGRTDSLTDRQTDRHDKANSLFRNFEHTSENTKITLGTQALRFMIELLVFGIKDARGSYSIRCILKDYGFIVCTLSARNVIQKMDWMQHASYIPPYYISVYSIVCLTITWFSVLLNLLRLSNVERTWSLSIEWHQSLSQQNSHP